MTQTERIRWVLRERGLTQKQVAEATGMKPQNLSKALQADSVTGRLAERIVQAVNALVPSFPPVAPDDLLPTEYTIRCPKCGEEITIEIK